MTEILTKTLASKIATGKVRWMNFVTSINEEVYCGEDVHPNIAKRFGLDKEDIIDAGALRGGTPQDPLIIVEDYSFELNIPIYQRRTTVNIVRSLINPVSVISREPRGRRSIM